MWPMEESRARPGGGTCEAVVESQSGNPGNGSCTSFVMLTISSHTPIRDTRLQSPLCHQPLHILAWPPLRIARPLDAVTECGKARSPAGSGCRRLAAIRLSLYLDSPLSIVDCYIAFETSRGDVRGRNNYCCPSDRMWMRVRDVLSTRTRLQHISSTSTSVCSSCRKRISTSQFQEDQY